MELYLLVICYHQVYIDIDWYTGVAGSYTEGYYEAITPRYILPQGIDIGRNTCVAGSYTEGYYGAIPPGYILPPGIHKYR